MIAFRRFILFGVLFSVSLGASTPTVTLYPPVAVTNKYDEGKSHFSFQRGLLEEITKSTSDWDLSYGGWILCDEDWFGLHFGPETRTVIKDLGDLNWDEPFTIPALQPRPLVEKGHEWQPTLVTNDPNGLWTRSGEFAKVVLRHMYLMHVKDETADFYVMFRVEEHEQHKRCVISWRSIPPPGQNNI